MIGQLHKRYLLGEYRLEPDKRLLSRGGRPVPLTEKPFQVLLYLIEHRDRYVSRAELLDSFWDGCDVYDDALRKCIGAIRKALEDQPESSRFVKTRWGGGYRYIGPLEEHLVHEETGGVEIERTRGVQVVVEEEETQFGAAADERQTTHRALVHGLPHAFRRHTKVTASALVLLAVAIGAAVLVRYRGQSAATESHPAPIRSIAVLPLRNLTGNPADEYLSDGITESLITALSKVEGLKVISRSSVFALKNRDLDPREVGRLLGVAAVLEGGVRQGVEQVHVDVRLVSALDGEVLWASDASDRANGDIFVVQDELARNVANGLRIKLSGQGGQRLAKRYTENVEAFQAYLKGRYFLNKRTPEGITKSIEYFRRAIEVDPNYALAYAGLAEGYDKAYWFMELHPKEVMAKQKEAAARAVQLDDSLAEAHVALATVYANGWDLLSAARELERAIELDPGNVDAHHNYAYRLIDLMRPDEAVAEIKRAHELDPLSVVMNIDVGEILLLARRYDEAIEALRHALEMDPHRANAHWDLAQAYAGKGMYAEAVAEHLEEFTLKGESPQAIAALKEAYTAAGWRGFWQKRLTQLSSKHNHVEPTMIALIYTDLGDKNQAFAWLEKAFQNRSPYLVGLKSSARLDLLRSDPRYDDLLRRVGLP